MKKYLYLIFALSACIHAAEQEAPSRIIPQFIQYYTYIYNYFDSIPQKIDAYFSQENMVCDQEIKDLFTVLITRPYHKNIATFLANAYKKQFIKFEKVITPEVLRLICEKYSTDLPELAFDLMHKASFKNDKIMCTYLTTLDTYYDLFQSFDKKFVAHDLESAIMHTYLIIFDKFRNPFQSSEKNKKLVTYSLLQKESYQSLLFLLNHKNLSIEKITQENSYFYYEHTLLHLLIFRNFNTTDVSKKVIAKTIEILKQYDRLNTYYKIIIDDKTCMCTPIRCAFELYNDIILKMNMSYTNANFEIINILLEEPTINITNITIDSENTGTILHLYLYLIQKNKIVANKNLLQTMIKRLTKCEAINNKDTKGFTPLGIAMKYKYYEIALMLLDNEKISILNIYNNQNILDIYLVTDEHGYNKNHILTNIIKKLINLVEFNQYNFFDLYIRNNLNDQELLNTIIEKIPDINVDHTYKESFLAQAFTSKNITVITTLLSHPCIQVHNLDSNNATALDCYNSAKINNPEILELILEKQTDIPPLQKLSHRAHVEMRLYKYGVPAAKICNTITLDLNTEDLKTLLIHGCTIPISFAHLSSYIKNINTQKNIKEIIAFNCFNDDQKIAETMQPHTIPEKYSSFISPLIICKLWIKQKKNKQFIDFYTPIAHTYNHQDALNLLYHAYTTGNNEIWNFLHKNIKLTETEEYELHDFIINTLACPEYLPNQNYETLAKHALTTRNERLFDKVRHHCNLPPVKMYTHPHADYNCRTYPLITILTRKILHKHINTKFCDLIIEHKQ